MKVVELKNFLVPFSIERRWEVDDPTVEAYLAYWTPWGDECVVVKFYRNGVISGGDSDWQAWLELTQLNPVLTEYNLGSSESEAEYYLLVDKVFNRFYLVPAKIKIAYALKYVREQNVHRRRNPSP